jgi:hypothetical protein
MIKDKKIKEQIKNACLISQKDVDKHVKILITQTLKDNLYDMAQNQIDSFIYETIAQIHKDKTFRQEIAETVRALLLRELPKQIEDRVRDQDIYLQLGQ